jgi:hypothetical protein
MVMTGGKEMFTNRAIVGQRTVEVLAGAGIVCLLVMATASPARGCEPGQLPVDQNLSGWTELVVDRGFLSCGAQEYVGRGQGQGDSQGNNVMVVCDYCEGHGPEDSRYFYFYFDSSGFWPSPEVGECVYPLACNSWYYALDNDGVVFKTLHRSYEDTSRPGGDWNSNGLIDWVTSYFQVGWSAPVRYWREALITDWILEDNSEPDGTICSRQGG